MVSFLAEAIFSLVLFFLLVFLYSMRDKYLSLTFRGWDKLLLGTFMLLLGSLLDLTDDLESVHKAFTLGSFPLDLFLKVGLYCLGMILVVSGPLNWLTEVLEWKKRTKEREKIINLLFAFSAKGKKRKSLLDIFNYALSEVSRYFQTTFGVLFLLDDLKDSLILESHVGLSPETIKNLEKIKLDHPPFGDVIKDGTPCLINDILSQERDLAAKLKEDSLESLLAVPILAKGKVLGVIGILRQERFGFNQADAKLLSSLGEQLGEVVESVRINSELSRKIERLKRLEQEAGIISKIANMLSSAYPTNAILDRLTVDSLQVIQATNATLFLLEGDQLVVKSTLEPDLINTRIEISNFPWARETVERKKPSIITELTRGGEPELSFSKRGVKSSLAVPLIFEDKVLGILLFENQEHVRTYSAWEIEQVQVMASLAALTLRKKEIGKKEKVETWQKKLDSSLEEWSNDVNNMLTGILGNVQLLEKNTKDKRVVSGHHTAEYLKTIEEAVLATSRMLKKIGNTPATEIKQVERILPQKEIPLPEEESYTRVQKEAYRVLVIDDQEIIRDLVRNILKGMGHETVLASNGKEGLEKFRHQEFDLVITDLGMPDISGWEVSSQIKKERTDIPIILITGWGIHPDPDKLKDSGIDFMLAKPFKVDQLEKTIRDAMELIKAKK